VDSRKRALVQLNVRVPAGDRDALQQLALEAGVSVTGLLGAIVHTFLTEHEGSEPGSRVPEAVLAHARSIDSLRRRRPHLTRRHREG
jgi:hypothetical protein